MHHNKSQDSNPKMRNSINIGNSQQEYLQPGLDEMFGASSASQVLHEAIIDLYLQVKVRSNDEIDRFGQDQLKKERERLLKFDSLTVLDYIKTSIEILMQIKGEGADSSKNNDTLAAFGLENVAYSSNINQNKDKLNDTGLSSTLKSIDLPSKEAELQLQAYEEEIRNHIKVE